MTEQKRPKIGVKRRVIRSIPKVGPLEKTPHYGITVTQEESKQSVGEATDAKYDPNAPLDIQWSRLFFDENGNVLGREDSDAPEQINGEYVQDTTSVMSTDIDPYGVLTSDELARIVSDNSITTDSIASERPEGYNFRAFLALGSPRAGQIYQRNNGERVSVEATMGADGLVVVNVSIYSR